MFDIPFNKPAHVGNELGFVRAAIDSGKLCGDGPFGKRCQAFFDNHLKAKTLLTPSCTHALEMAALLLEIQPGDEIIMPSFTFVSTANAFALRGARIVFVDVRPDTMNIDESLIEAAISERTKAIVPVHYAGVSCEMSAVVDIAARHGLFVVEDAAQAFFSSYKGLPLGSIGDLGAFSFHETKNLNSGGEGGLLIVGNTKFSNRAEIVREKGTNRSTFLRGEVDKYSWIDLGSSYLPSEIQAAFLWGQLESARSIIHARRGSWERYESALIALQQRGDITLPYVPRHCEHNGHIFYIKVADLETRSRFIKHMKSAGIQCVSHYVPLHSAAAAASFATFHGDDRYTTSDSERLVRLPLFFGISDQEIDRVIEGVRNFFVP